MGDALKIPVVESLVKTLDTKRSDILKGKINSYPRKNPILSDLGDCDRQIVYGVTHWQSKPMVNIELQARFEVGKLWEREIIRSILEMGLDFAGGQESVTIRGRGGILLATGRIDGFIVYEGEKIPCEIKSMSPHIYENVDTLEDFQKKPWLRKYVRQLQMYLYGHNKEYGLFGLTNCLGGIKWIVVYLDLGECELLLQRLESVHEHLVKGTLPDRIDFNRGACERCDYAQICLPDVMRNEAEILTDPDIIVDLEAREQVKDAAARYKELDASLKKRLKGIKKGVAGPFLIQSKEMPGRHQEAFDVEPYFITSIKKL